MPGRRSDRPPPILKLAHDATASSSSSAAAAAQLPFAACGSSIHSTRVHFPPTPKLTCKGLTYPPHAYDRAPIVVSENTCALPRRGDRAYHAPPGADDRECQQLAGRTPRRTAVALPSAPASPAGCYFALGSNAGADVLSPSSSGSSSSESDDSDTSVATPPDYSEEYYGRRRAPAHGPPKSALAFLPHPHVVPPVAPPPPVSAERKRRSLTPCRPRRSPTKCSSFTSSSFGDEADCLGGF